MGKFSIVIPVYNEGGNITPLLDSFLPFINKFLFELILVNDGSKDDTETILFSLDIEKYFFVRTITYKNNKGYGGAILRGLQEAKGDVLGFMHSDLQTDTKYIFDGYLLFLELQKKHKNIFVKGVRINRRIGQTLFSFSMSLVCSCLFFRNLFEINAQPKLFDRQLYNLFRPPPLDFSFDLYIYLLAKQNSFFIKTLPVNFKNRVYGTSSWSSSYKTALKTITRTLKYIFSIRLGLK